MFRKNQKLLEGQTENQVKRRSKFWKPAGQVLIAAVIFLVGWGVGNGRIPNNFRSGFHKPVSSGLPEDLDYSDVEAVYDSLRANFDGQLDRDKLIDGLKAGLVNAAGDPYTEYFNKEDAADFNEQLNGTFTGIGAELSKDPKTKAIIVVSPIAGYPADKAGLKPKDVVIEIDGKSAYDISVDDAVKMIRGDAGTSVKLKIVRGGKEEHTFDIVRETITIPSVETKTLNGNIGYIKITRFAEDTTELVQKAAKEFKDKNVKGIVVDVRNDPGGLLEAAINVSSLWLHDKQVLSERRGGEVVKTFQSEGDPILQGIPTVVLINEGSASASEITAGALHDNKAATLIGVKSFGKGSVQQLVSFRDGSQLKVTVARWYTPGGKNIDKEGITPDKVIKLTDADAKAKRDPQLDAALKQLNSQ